MSAVSLFAGPQVRVVYETPRMATKLIPHRRQQAIRKVVFSARAEPLEERGGQDRRWSAALNRGMGGPTAFPRVGYASRIFLQVRLSRQRLRSQIEEP